MAETNKKKKLQTPQLVTILVLFCIVGFVVIATDKLPVMVEGSPGPRFMPLVLAALMALLTVLYALESYIKQTLASSMPAKEELKRPALFVFFCILLTLLWESLGAVLTVLFVSLLELYFLEEMGWKRSLAVSMGASIVTWVIFDALLGVSLPLGILKNILYN